MTFTRSNPPQNRDTTGRFLAGQSGNPGGLPQLHRRKRQPDQRTAPRLKRLHQFYTNGLLENV